MKGLELLFQIEKTKLTSKQSTLVISTHCFLINENFKCVGLGDEWKNETELNSELLPENWEANENVYTIRYKDSEGTKYMMKIIKSDVHLLVNLLDIDNDKASGTAFIIEEFVNDIGDFKSTYKNLDTFFKRLETEVLMKKKNEKGTVTEDNLPDDNDPSLMASSRPRPRPRAPLEENWNPLYRPIVDPRNIGHSDLDPFGVRDPFAGGMLFDPISNNRGMIDPSSGFNPLPRGSVPPGARFDPIGPVIPGGRQPRPAPGFFPPPDYNDMFL